MRIILAQPRGFCAGVVRAIEIVDRALERHGAPVYVRHEIVHNRHVVDNLRGKGARFVEKARRSAARGSRHFQRARRGAKHRARCRRARPRRSRRNLPARHEGSCSGPAVCRAGPHADSDRPRGTSGSGRHRRADSRPGRARAKRGRSRDDGARAGYAGRLRDADDAFRRRHARHHRRVAAPFHRYRRPGHAGHLLRNAEPAGRRARVVVASGRAARGRRNQQFH